MKKKKRAKIKFILEVLIAVGTLIQGIATLIEALK